MESVKNYTYSTASEMFRSVLGEEAVKPVKVRPDEKRDSAVTDYMRKFASACVASAGGLMWFK
jgi:hypothetical protein